MANLGRAVWNTISTQIHADYEGAEIDRLAEANARLVLNFSKRAPLDKVDLMTAVANEVVEGDEGFTIRTVLGNKFTRDDLTLQRRYTQPGAAAYLSYAMAWNEAAAFLDQVG